MFKPVNPKQNFPELEGEITKFWKENKIFEKSVENRSAKNSYIFYDGPPFITGTPHYGSLLPSIAKDVIPRYQTMRGKRVERVWGWDCHGLPIENKVEKKLGIKNRREIEKYGIDRFIDECYNYTRETSAEWKWYIDKIGRWVDMDNAYRTMDQDYMETVMWVFKQLHEKDLIYKGMRTSLYCTRCGTPVSNFEIAMDNSYADMEDPAVTIKFPVTTPGEFSDSSILAWTTTPWTLPSNKALVIDPEETYIKAKVQKLTIELEQSWQVKELPENLKKLKRSEITQAYLEDYIDENGIKPRDARIRRIDSKFEFTTKYYAGKSTETGQLIEKTKEITKEEYIELIKQTKAKVVKTRYYYPLEDGLTAEIDVYRNQHEGVNFVEVEFSSLKKLQNFKKPEWFGKEVTDCDACFPKYMADKSSERILSEIDTYVQAEHNYEENVQTDNVILAKKRAEYALENIDYEIVEEFEGKKLLGLKYRPPFDYYKTEKGEHQVYGFPGMVHMEEGTGIVHSAPGFGDIDTEMGQEYGLSIAMTINDEGKYLPQVKDFVGLYVKDADQPIIENLKSRDILFKVEKIVHRYPYCWRCETPLIHKAQPSWFIDIEKIRKDLLKNNEDINWVPKHLKHGRFKKGIEVAPDWGISRTRYWATPMPVWQREEEGQILETKVIGSRDELREHANQPITKITFVRHGNKSQDDSLDPGMTDLGHQQAKELAKKLSKEKFDVIISSPKKRTLQTAEYIKEALGQEFIEDNLFTSLTDGDGREFYRQIKKQHNVEYLHELPESILREKIFPVLTPLKENFEQLLKKFEGKNILIISHSGKIKFLEHIIEGSNLRAVLTSKIKEAGTYTAYFHGTDLLDLHRPKIDQITLKGKTGELTRVKEVLDVWMDSASMPYASKHYPFENKQMLEENYPADFIVEYIAQTRAWFYVMHVISTALLNQPSFKNVITTGVIFGTDGRKMSKSYGNYPDPRDVLENYGAETLRMYLMGSKIMLGEDMNFDEDALKEQYKTFLLPLWNSYSFFVTYANIHNWEPSGKLDSKDQLDKWIVAKLDETKSHFIKAMDSYNIPSAVKLLPEFIDILSRWYIRRSRSRFAQGSEDALSTLHYILVEFTKLSASVVPFVSEEIFQNLQNDNQFESVHLSDLEKPKKSTLENNASLLQKMELVREISTLGQSLRVQNNLKVRQPLQSVEIYLQDKNLATEGDMGWMNEIVKDELNVKQVKFVNKKPENELLVSSGLNDTLFVGLDSKLTPELEAEGILRELTRQIQSQRKKLGLNMGDKIDLTIQTDDKKLDGIIKKNQKGFAESVNATNIHFTTANLEHKLSINGSELTLSLS
ncbi:MAG TPA: class I tRNA ligase family protein [Candidatus Dojkabacteria bacterium]|nr:class I tRNA ligase family protein [Candidatus Dojkabacteria bacterium]